jgi:putative membrane protein
MNSEKKTYFAIVLISLTIFLFLAWLIYVKPVARTDSVFIYSLPILNAILNTLTSSFLVAGIIFVKKKKIDLHKKMMIAATTTSAFFLISYITYHHFHGDTKFLGMGAIRKVYFFILISHISLSAIQVPLILTTLYLAFAGKTDKHKAVAKFTFPIWLYVSVTGVLIFVFLRWFNSV